jgi:hypothetical protein
MADGKPPDSEDLVFRRGKLRRRDDPAFELYREALEHLDDLPRVKRVLLELGRLYDPVTNGPVLPSAVRRQVLERLDGGRLEEARQLLADAFKRYGRKPEPP